MPRRIIAMRIVVTAGIWSIAGLGACDPHGTERTVVEPGRAVTSLAPVALHQGLVSDLGALPGNRDSYAHGVNDAGQVAGYSQVSGGFHAVRWEPSRVIRDLGTLGAGEHTNSFGRAITANGRVAGLSDTPSGDIHAFIWSAADGMRDLGTLPGGRSSYAYGVSASGNVAGLSYTASGEGHAVVWTEAGIQDLGTLPGAAYAAALAVNDAQQAVGAANPGPFRPQHAFLWTKQDGMRDLGTLPGGDQGGDQSAAFAINSRGQVVGASTIASGVTHAFLWSAKTGMVDLGTLPGGTQTLAYGIDNAGRVVGEADVVTTPHVVHAFLWSAADGMRDLGTVEDNPPHQFSSFAYGISQSGLIVGYSERRIGGYHAVLWSGFATGRGASNRQLSP